MRLNLLFIICIAFLFFSSVSATEPFCHVTVAPQRLAVSNQTDAVHSINHALEILGRQRCQQKHITLAPGIYRERVVVSLSNIVFNGSGRDNTVIVYDLHAAAATDLYPGGWGTPGSATVVVRGSEVVFKNLTIENDFDFLSNDKRTAKDPARIREPQAVALLLDDDSDRIFLENVAIQGYQDTLFAKGKRAYVLNSRIAGNVDFIFGSGQVLFEQSDIVSRRRARQFTAGAVQGHITAPSTSMADAYGLVFYRCRLLAEPGVPPGSVSLGRPWHPTRTFHDGRYADPDAIGYAFYIHTFMAEHVRAEGWASMRGTDHSGQKGWVFTPQSARFFELQSSGPGAHLTNTVRQIFHVSDEDDIGFIRTHHFAGWSTSPQSERKSQ